MSTNIINIQVGRHLYDQLVFYANIHMFVIDNCQTFYHFLALFKYWYKNCSVPDNVNNLLCPQFE